VGENAHRLEGMQLPNEIISTIESLVERVPLSELSRESGRLTGLYRDRELGGDLPSLGTDLQRLAYLAARFPSTYVVVYKVLMELLGRARGIEISSLLDVGAGPGTAFLAALETPILLKAATLVERDPGFIELGKKLALGSIQQTWICQDITKELTILPHDLVVASYSLNELKEKERNTLLEKLWGLTQKFLVIIEPGTKSAFESLMTMREKLFSLDAHLIAPCPHSNPCPLLHKNWCHFFARVERSSLQRKTKEATLNYEDEKFSYLIFSKIQIEPCQSRVICHPFKGKGFIKLPLCTRSGIEEKTITKKNKPTYLEGKKLEWGDSLN
jgi:ribosomal protein RSM22 (predicted rRNA methylase)